MCIYPEEKENKENQETLIEWNIVWKIWFWKGVWKALENDLILSVQIQFLGCFKGGVHFEAQEAL